MPLTTFLTAAGFLAAILLVWAQSWLNAYKLSPLPRTVGLGLVWTYLAVIIALVAFAWAGWSYLAKPTKYFIIQGCPLGLLVATLVMTLVNVAQSLVFTVVKMLKFKDDWSNQPAFEITNIPKYLIVLGCVAILIITLSLLGAKWQWIWILEVVGLFIFGMFVMITKIKK